MKFELKFSDNSTVIVDINDAEVKAWVKAKADTTATNVFHQEQGAKGMPVSVVVR